MKIRHSTDADRNAITDIHANAFGQEQGPEIIELIADLFTDATAEPVLSLIADLDGIAVGHVLFTMVTVESDRADVTARILAPLAVKQEFQKKGVGTALIKAGLTELTDTGVDLVFVLGDPAYYSRLAFRPAGVLGLTAPHPIPAEHADAWMVQSLRAGILGIVTGSVRCSDVLNDPRHWLEDDSELVIPEEN
ncbi:MAG: N-acetyltransferase [Cyanobacteria bacterium P01_B01_bin.77]